MFKFHYGKILGGPIEAASGSNLHLRSYGSG